MRRLSWVQYFIPLVLLVYAVVGFARIRSTDWVPFSAWALFVFVPGHVTSYTIRIDKVNDQVLTSPKLFAEAEGLVPDPHDIQAYYLINHFGMALRKGDSSEAANFRKLFETNSLKGKVEYTLLEVGYDPLIRWRTDQLKQVEVGRFEANLSYTSGKP